jgi:hypothetical protein
MKKNIYPILFVAGVFTLWSCQKENEVIDMDPVIPAERARFVIPRNTPILSDSVKTYFIPSTNDPLKIAVGFTTVSDVDRKIAFTYTSTDAVAGVQYTAPAEVIVPAGKAVDTLSVTGLFGGFSSASRIDTVVIRIDNTNSTAPASTQIMPTKVTVYLRQFCSEAAPVFSMLTGNYNNTHELFGTGAYGPYQTQVSNITSLTATTAKISISNIWDTGWGPIDFTINWTNPAAPTTTVIAGVVPSSDAGDLNPTYAGLPVAVRVHATNPTGTYSACNQTFVVYMQLGVSGVGWFNNVYRVTLGR